jgi:hypothetical protein
MSRGNFSLFFCPNLRGAFFFAFLKKDGGIRPLLCGSIWRRCAARLTSDCTRDAAHTYFTTTYANFMQCAGGLQDGATRCAQLLNMLHDLCPTADQDPDDPVTFINTDIKAAFQEMCRQASFDTLTGKATQPYDDGRVQRLQPGDDIPTINELRPFLGYFNAMRLQPGDDIPTINELRSFLGYLNTAPPPTTVTVITAGTRITSKAQLAVSRGMAWR